MIRIPQVRVVDQDGSQLGVMPTPQALAMAQERGLDLVEVAPMAAPPVVRFLDFGQYKYELTKREKEAKRKQRSVTFKEVRLKPKIGIGDFDTKVRRAIEFLEEGDRIKVAVQFRGRELTHPEIGRGLLTKFVEQIKEHGIVERSPLLEGKSMHITVASVHKPKVIEHVDKHAAETSDETAAEPQDESASEPATAPSAAAIEAPATTAATAATSTEPETPAELPAPAGPAMAASPVETDVPAATAPRPASRARRAAEPEITTNGTPAHTPTDLPAPKPAPRPARPKTSKTESEATAPTPAGE